MNAGTGTLPDVRRVLAAYNAGDPRPLISTFAPEVHYELTAQGRVYRGREEVSELARAGAGRARFHVHELITSGHLVAYSYVHESSVEGMVFEGPAMAVQQYDGSGRLLTHWAVRDAVPSRLA